MVASKFRQRAQRVKTRARTTQQRTRPDALGCTPRVSTRCADQSTDQSPFSAQRINERQANEIEQQRAREARELASAMPQRNTRTHAHTRTRTHAHTHTHRVGEHLVRAQSTEVESAERLSQHARSSHGRRAAERTCKTLGRSTAFSMLRRRRCDRRPSTDARRNSLSTTGKQQTAVLARAPHLIQQFARFVVTPVAHKHRRNTHARKHA